MSNTFPSVGHLEEKYTTFYSYEFYLNSKKINKIKYFLLCIVLFDNFVSIKSYRYENIDKSNKLKILGK